MQEQPHYNITPEQGWSKIKSVLDIEMPVNRRSRRFIFFWWTASALLILGVAGLSLFKGFGFFSPSSPADQTQIESAAINKDAKADQHVVPSEIQPQELKSAIQSLNIEEYSSSYPVEHKPPSSNQNIQTDKTKQKPTQDKTGIPKATLPMASLDAPGNTISEKGVESLNQYTTEMESSDDLAATKNELPLTEKEIGFSGIKNSNAEKTDALPCLPISAFKRKEQKPDYINPGTIPKTKQTRNFIDPTFLVSALSGQQGGVGGYVGAGVAMNVSRKISITTTFGHRSFNPDGSLFSFARSKDASVEISPILNMDPVYEGIPVYLDGLAVNASASYTSIIPFVETVRQWQVSSGLKWSVSKRFFAEGGWHFGFNTKVLSQYPIITPDGSSIASNARIENYLNSYDIVRSTMTSVYVGAGYKFGRHLDLFANWSYSFESYLLNETVGLSVDQEGNERTDYIRGLNLGLRYTL